MDTKLHERLLHMLSTMLIQLNAIQTLVNNELTLDVPTIREEMAVLEQITRDVLNMVRSTSDDVPPELEGVTLAEALTRIVEETAEALDLSSRLSFNGEHNLSSSAERVLYAIAREALYHVSQHVRARKLRVVLTYGQDEVQMSIEDDGTLATVVDDVPIPAFALNPTNSNTYSDLRHRIEQLGGSLEVGTRVLARIPYLHHSEKVMDQPSVSETSIRVLVVDGQAVTRAGLRRLVESYTDLVVVGEAADGVQAVSETLELGPQVVLMDSQLSQSLEALRQIKQLNPDTKVLLLSTQDREEYLYETLRAGADGYVLKDIVPDELAQAIRVVSRGEVLVQPQLAGKLLSRLGKRGRGSYESLTVRELEVLRLLARGLRNKEIAARLYVSERTVNFHLANIYQKLNVSGRTEALSKALEQGLITP